MKRSITLSLLMTFILLVTSEVVVRVFLARKMSGRFEYGYSPTAGFVEHANGTVNLVRAGGRAFHPQTFPKVRPPGTFRVITIGDSVTRGATLATSYAALIGDKLRAAGVKAESFNLSVSGNGALRSQVVLRKALDYQPSLIILHVNNSNEFEDERELKRAEEFKSWHPKNWLMKSLVVRWLYEVKTEQVFWKWLPEEIRRQKNVNDANAQILASMNEEKVLEWDERVRRFTSESAQLCRARGVPILLITQVRLERSFNGSAFLNDRGLDALGRSLAGAGVYHLSMKEIFSPTNFESLFLDSAHVFTPGHERIAAAVVEKLREEGLIAIGR